MNDQDDDATNAVRYALLRRLTPGIRHRLLGELQSIESLAELARRQLQVGSDSIQVQDGLSHIITHARKAVENSCSIVEWLRPEAGATIPVGQGIAQCLTVVGDDWPLRGIEASTDLPGAEHLVDRATLRELLTASLIALIDMHPGMLDIHVRSSTGAYHIDLNLQARAADRRVSMSRSDRERKFTWADMQVLANVHGVVCTCHAYGATLRLRRIANDSSSSDFGGATRDTSINT